MKQVAYILFLCSFLLSGGTALAKETRHNKAQPSSTSSHTIEKRHHIKTTDPNSSIVEDTDLDMPEESHVSNIKDSRFFTEKFNLPDNWHFAHPRLLVLNNQFKSFKTFTLFSGNSPIYIFQRVLRL